MSLLLLQACKVEQRLVRQTLKLQQATWAVIIHGRAGEFCIRIKPGVSHLRKVRKLGWETVQVTYKDIDHAELAIELFGMAVDPELMPHIIIHGHLSAKEADHE